MSTTPTPQPVPVATHHTGFMIDTILHDVIAFGVVAASIFVKNPKSQTQAATIMQAVQSLLPMVDTQLQNGIEPAPVAQAAQTAPAAQVTPQL